MLQSGQLQACRRNQFTLPGQRRTFPDHTDDRPHSYFLSKFLQFGEMLCGVPPGIGTFFHFHRIQNAILFDELINFRLVELLTEIVHSALIEKLFRITVNVLAADPGVQTDSSGKLVVHLSQE